MFNTKELAFLIINNAFENQVDLGGKPYTEHLYRVANEAKRKHGGEIAYLSGLLHDVLEDCPEWNERALRELFSTDVVNTVVQLTKFKMEKYDDYIDRLINSNNPYAIAVKIADLEDNMDIKRINTPLTMDHIKRIEKYHRSYLKLNKQL